jgi:hypothetical protein
MAPSRSLAMPTYLVAFALIVIPPFDTVMQLMPLRPGDPRWRFGAFGLLSNAMMIPLVGLLLAFIAATVYEHLRTRQLLGVLSLLVAFGVGGLFVLFGLDALQIRQDVRPNAQLAVKVASITAAAKAILGLITLAGFTFAAFRGAKQSRMAKPKKGSGGLIIGARPNALSAPPVSVTNAPPVGGERIDVE